MSVARLSNEKEKELRQYLDSEFGVSEPAIVHALKNFFVDIPSHDDAQQMYDVHISQCDELAKFKKSLRKCLALLDDTHARGKHFGRYSYSDDKFSPEQWRENLVEMLDQLDRAIGTNSLLAPAFRTTAGKGGSAKLMARGLARCFDENGEPVTFGKTILESHRQGTAGPFASLSNSAISAFIGAVWQKTGIVS